MSNMDYDDKDQDEGSEQDPASLEGKGWDILAGGKDNPFSLGGEDPFDLKSPENPDPYTDDDEADWIIQSGVKDEATGEPIPSDAYWDRGRGTSAADAAPRDLSPEELGAIPPTEGEKPPVTGPITAPAYLFPGGDEGEPAAAASESAEEETAGLSYGVTVTPIGPEGEPPVTPPSPTVSPGTSTYEAPSVPPGSTLTELTGGALSPGVEVTPLGPDGQPVAPPQTAPGTPPLGSPSGEVPQPSSFEPPLGGPIQPPGGPLPPTTPGPLGAPGAAPDMPPWDLPQQPQGLLPSDFISDPFFSPPKIRDEVGEELKPEEDLATLLITKERVNALWDEIDETYNLVIDDVRGHFDSTDQAIRDLKRAQELLLAGAEHYDNAQRLVIEVKARLRLEQKVREWSRTTGTWLGVYLVIWLLMLSIASLFTNRVNEIITAFIPVSLAATWLPSLFGGLGGVVGAIWVLVKHIAVKRDFDPIHMPWYVLTPILGVAMGVVTYFLVLVAGVVFQSAVLQNAANSPVLLLLCIIVGFNQNVLWSLITRVFNTIFPRPPEEEKATVEKNGSTTPGEPSMGPQG